MFRRFKFSGIQTIFITIATGAVVTTVILLLLHFRTVAVPATVRVGEGMYSPSGDTSNLNFDRTLMAGNLSIPVSIAADEASRDQGLSGTSALATNSGKLFIFPRPGKYGFWMKDMNYPLDFIWISSDLKIVGITANVAADTYPKIFYPPTLVRYVLEVNAGFSTAQHLSVGQQFVFEK